MPLNLRSSNSTKEEKEGLIFRIKEFGKVTKMAKSKQAYEEIRQKTMAENKKRMEELNITKLSQDVLSISKPSPVKKVKPRIPKPSIALISVRRSNRVADKPPVSYKEVPMELLDRPRRSYQRRDLLNRVYASDEVRTYAIERAEEIDSNLEGGFPSFVKPMLQSHVTGGFWLGLPVPFSKTHLPHYDEMITLEDENGEESETKYLAKKTGLSAGWRGFAIEHELVDGDALVFQLVNPTKFKVYIVRAYDSDENGEQESIRDNEDKENVENNDENSDATHLVRRSKRGRPSRK